MEIYSLIVAQCFVHVEMDITRAEANLIQLTRFISGKNHKP